MVKNSSLRAAGYCRTSSEGQRDNTSIPVQRSEIERFVESNHWSFVRHYVDECKTGSQIDGRDEFKQMMSDAAKGEFDVLIIFNISRFSRDGADIIETARTLKRAFGVHVIDTKRLFDTREPGNALINFVGAGMAEQERLAILERTTRGRMANASHGKPWSANPPIGRVYCKKTNQWIVTDKGRAIAQLIHRYLNGESLTMLFRELGLGRSSKLSDWTIRGQLAGIYEAKFDSPELGIKTAIPIPAVPEVVSMETLEKVRARMQHNRTHNRVDVKRYLLTGFIRCEHCGRALNAQFQDGQIYYRHPLLNDCVRRSVRGGELEAAVLEYLYGHFLDEPAFNTAVERSMPSVEYRQGLVKELAQTEKRIAKNELAINRLIKAITDGADVGLLLSKQIELKAEKEALANRRRELETILSNLPSAEHTQAAAAITRIRLSQMYKHRNWRQLTHDEIKKFFFHLFGESKRGGKTGIFVRKEDSGNIIATFKGQIDFHHHVRNGRTTSRELELETNRMNDHISREYEQAYKAATAQFTAANSQLKPLPDCNQPGPPC